MHRSEFMKVITLVDEAIWQSAGSRPSQRCPSPRLPSSWEGSKTCATVAPHEREKRRSEPVTCLAVHSEGNELYRTGEGGITAKKAGDRAPHLPLATRYKALN